MASNVRIQLEGRLEKVERAARTWEKVGQSLRGDEWRGGALFAVLDGISADVEATVQEVRRKAGTAPEVQQALARLERAQTSVRAQAEARLKRVGATPVPGDTPAVLAQLKAELTGVHQERLGWDWPGALATLAMVLCFTAFVVLREGWIGYLALIPLAAAPIALWKQSTRVLVTARTLVLDRQSVPIADIVRVRARIAEVPNRRGKQCEIDVYTRSHGVVRVSSSGKPTALMRVLQDRGVTCEVEDDWRFFL